MGRPDTSRLRTGRGATGTADEFDFTDVTWEIRITRGNTIIFEIFLPIPPETEDRAIPQRINLEKTIGGSVLFNFGTDNPTITISGTTGSPARIYVVRGFSEKRSASGFQVLSGAEIYDFLRTEFANWAENAGINDDPLKSSDFKMTLRDYYNKETYEVTLDGNGVRFTRDKSLSQWYKYTMNFIVLNEVKNERRQDPEERRQENAFNSFVRQINRAANTLTLAGRNSRDFMARQVLPNKVLLKAIDNLFTGVSQFAVDIREINRDITDTKEIFTETVNASIRIGFNLLALAEGILVDYKGSGGSLGDDFALEIKNVKSQLEKVKNVFSKIPRFEVITVFDASKSEDNLMGSLLAPDRGIEETDSNVKTVTQDTARSVIYEVEEGDNFDLISFRFYGTVRRWQELSVLNNIGNEELVPGLLLTIPNISSDVNSSILTGDVNDKLGKDILVLDGDFVVGSDGDIAGVSGIDNLVQDIQIVIRTIKGTFSKNPTFGAGGLSIGVPTDLVRLTLERDIDDELSKDPRIKSVIIKTLVIIGDKIEADFDVLLITGQSISVAA